MTYSFDNDVALSVLRKYDSQCHNIIDACIKVKIYNYDKSTNSWVIQDQSEGAFYLVERILEPFYKFVILSKYNKPGSFPLTTDIPISEHNVTRCHDNFYMFKNEVGVIQSIMFPTKEDCSRICKKVDMIITDLKVASEKLMLDSCKKTMASNAGAVKDNSGNMNTESSDDKILNLLESARQRYNKGLSESEAVLISNEDRQSRQININELFTTSNYNGAIMTNMHKSYSKKTQPAINTYDNSNMTLTVTELEKLFAPCGIVNSAKVPYDEDDDVQLLDPHKLSGTSRNGSLLSKDDLKDTLIHILQSDEDGGIFLSKLHSAYIDLCQKKAAKK